MKGRPKYVRLEDWRAVKLAGGDAGPPPRGGVGGSFDLDPEERLVSEQMMAGAPKVSWGRTDPDGERRRAVDLALEQLGLRPPLRW
jgi:hypothetical protein